MTPKTRLRPSDRSARTPPSSTPLSSASSKKMSKTASGFISHAQVGFADRVGRQQFGGAAGGADAAGLQQVGTVDDAEDLLHVLLDDEHGEAAGADALDEVEHLLDEDRREPGRRLVEQQQPGRRHEGAADGAHLLLAAGHAAGELAMALPKTRKQLVDDVELLAEFRPGRRREAAYSQIVFDRHAREQAAALRHVGDAELDDPVRRRRRQIGALQADRARRGPDQPRDGAHERRLAGPVRADDTDRLAGLHVERDVEERLKRAVPGADRPELEHQRRADAAAETAAAWAPR